jgi:hypothetical protein
MANMREGLAELQGSARAFDALGMPKTADHVRQYGRNMAGQAGDWDMRFMQNWRDPWKRFVVRNLGDSEIAKAVPDIFDYSINQFYSAVLGGRPDAVVRNLTQNLTLTAPEIGQGKSLYGYRKIGQAVGDVAGDLVGAIGRKIKGDKFEWMEAELQRLGHIKPKHDLEAARLSFANGLDSVPFLNLGKAAIDRLSEGWMWFYQKSDVMNRYISLKAANRVVDDFNKGNKVAQRAIKRMPADARVEFMRAKSPAEQQKLYQTYLIDKTQHVYGKEGMNEAGRQYGRLVSMLTTWPINQTTETAYLLRDIAKHEGKGGAALGKLVGKAFTPFMAFYAIHQYADEEQLFDTFEGRALLGKSFKGKSPIESIGQVGLPPQVAVPWELANETLRELDKEEPDWEEFRSKQLDRAAPLIPGYGAGHQFIKRYEDL